MSNLPAASGWGLVIGTSLLVGALVAARLRLPERVAATITAFGGGLLFAAVALELLPEADAQAGTALTAAGLLVGTGIYVGVDAWLTRDRSMEVVHRSRHAAAAGMPMMMTSPEHAEAARGKSIAAGIFVDGVPESLALGLTIAQGRLGLALLVGVVVGNLVESYGAAQPIVAGGYSNRYAAGLLGGIGVALACTTILGGTVLADARPALVGTAQAVAAGAVLAVVSISVIPYAFSQVSRRVAVAAAVGVVGGYLLS